MSYMFLLWLCTCLAVGGRKRVSRWGPPECFCSCYCCCSCSSCCVSCVVVCVVCGVVGWCWCLLLFAVACVGPCPSLQRFTFLMPMGPGSTFLYQHGVVLVVGVVFYSVVVCVVGGGVVVGVCLVAVCYCATGIAIVHRRWGPLCLTQFSCCCCCCCDPFVVGTSKCAEDGGPHPITFPSTCCCSSTSGSSCSCCCCCCCCSLCCLLFVGVGACCSLLLFVLVHAHRFSDLLF